VASGDTDLISPGRLAELNRRRDAAGWRQVAGHGGLIVLSAAIWLQPSWPWALRLPALLLLGWGLAFGFCAMHECGHRTAFADRASNDAVAWWAGVLSFYNADFYRRYHQWHHRYTNQPGLDPELEEDHASRHRAAYLLELSGVSWWLGKLRSHWRGLRGDFSGCPYIPPRGGGGGARVDPSPSPRLWPAAAGVAARRQRSAVVGLAVAVDGGPAAAAFRADGRARRLRHQ
jgi:fatty acid desaturase